MNKKVLISAIMALGVCFASCNKDNNGSSNEIPEGTSNVSINEDDTQVTASNVTNWTQYAVQVANLLTNDATTLRNAWLVDYKAGGPYAEQFMNPEGTEFKSYSGCVQQIIEGCADIANEVGTAKIGEPRDLWEAKKYTEAVYAVESWYSYHSIDDYSNNILSIRNAFNGTCNGSEATSSIAAYLKKNNNALYEQTKSEINAAYNAIKSMAAPFRSHIGNSSVTKAQEACAALESTLTNKVKPVLVGGAEADLKPIIVDYVNNVVKPTYELLVTRNVALNSAVRALANNPSTSTFAAAANAWMEAREPWEMSEAFLFGPVADLGLDPNMDSWPLDAAALKNILNNGKFEELEWEGEFDEEDETIGAAQNVRGFHTLEFLLFYMGQPRQYSK